MMHGIFHFGLRACVVVIGLWVARVIFHAILPMLAHINSPKSFRDRILMRYQQKDFGAWMFAWFKTGMDPMFHELPGYLESVPDVKCFLDLGCGFGIAGCFVLEWYPDATAFAIDPTPHRVRGAAGAMGERGRVFVGSCAGF